MDCSKPPCKTAGLCCAKKKQQLEECNKVEDVCPKDPGKGKLSSGGKVKRFFANLKHSGRRGNKEGFAKRKCILQKYSDTKGKKNKCCPGLTGHHLIAGATFTDTGYCYEHNNALTVCSSGTSWHLGRHGLMHIETCRRFIDWKISNPRRTKMSIEELSNESVEAMKVVFKDSGCDWKCLKKELVDNYSNEHKEEGDTCKKISSKSKFEPHCGISARYMEASSMLDSREVSILSTLNG